MKSKLMALADEACSHIHNNKYVDILRTFHLFVHSVPCVISKVHCHTMQGCIWGGGGGGGEKGYWPP